MAVNHSITQAGKTEDFALQLARGQVYNHRHIFKFGFNDDCGATSETIWLQGGLYTWSSAAVKLKISSSSAQDDNTTGTGAWTVVVEGLDGNYEEISETVTMDGTTPVETTATFLRTHRMYVATAGTGLTNAGVIYAADTGDTYGTPGVPDTATGIRSTIGASEGQTLQAFYTIPAGYTGYLTQIKGSSSNANNSSTLRFFARPFGGAFRVQNKFIVFRDTVILPKDIPLKYLEKTDLEMRVVGNVTATDASAAMSIILVKN